MRDRYSEFEKKGANVVAIGLGLPMMAQDFKEQFRVPFPVLVDTKKNTYRLMTAAKAGLMQLIGPKQLIAGLKMRRQGFSLPKQDPNQLGAALVVGKGGKLLFKHLARDAADHPPVDALLGALP